MLKEQSWWNSLIERLRVESLSVLAREHGVSVEDLARALSEIGASGPAHTTPWWPEARRLRFTASIREIARRFHTNPRRIRRGFARMGLRVGGRDLAGRGVPELQSLRDELGRVPDGVLAKKAHVVVEAVQGERRRLHIPAFRPSSDKALMGLDEDDRAWILGPVRPVREKHRPLERLEVVRRPLRGTETESRAESSTDSLPDTPEEALERAGTSAPETRPVRVEAVTRKRLVRIEAPLKPKEEEPKVRRIRKTDVTSWRSLDIREAAKVVEELAKAEASRPPPRIEPPRPEPARYEPSRLVQAPRPARSETPRPEPARHEPIRTNPARTAQALPSSTFGINQPGDEIRWRVTLDGGELLLLQARDLNGVASRLHAILPPSQRCIAVERWR
jgi:hypothetical protein